MFKNEVTVGFFIRFGAEIRPQSQSEFLLNFPQNCLKNFPIQNFLKKNFKIFFFYVMFSCILFLQLTELAFIYCYNYLNTLNTLPI